MAVELEDFWPRVARELRVIEINEPLSAEDRQVIADKWLGFYEGVLEVRGMGLFDPAGPIPERYVLAIEALMAAHCANAFQVQAPDTSWAMPALNRAVTPEYTYDETRYEDF